MPITNENTLRFTREQVRGYAKSLLKLAWAVRRMQLEWFAQHSAVCGGANSGELLADNAQAEGRPPMTGGNVSTVVGKLIEKLGSSAITDADINVLLVATHNDEEPGLP